MIPVAMVTFINHMQSWGCLENISRLMPHLQSRCAEHGCRKWGNGAR